MMTLDPQAFKEDRYWEICDQLQAGDVISRRLFGQEVCGEPAITAENWLSDWEIVEVRALYQEIKKLEQTGQLRQSRRMFSYCEPHEDTRRALYTDGQGRPRMYLYEGGSDDSSVTRELYYDDVGGLRFAFIKAAAVNGTEIEHRLYFSTTGERIWEIQKRLKGPGYTFPAQWPDDDLTLEPVANFHAKSRCPEEK